VLKNASALADGMLKRDFKLVSGGALSLALRARGAAPRRARRCLPTLSQRSRVRVVCGVGWVTWPTGRRRYNAAAYVLLGCL